MCKGVNNLVYNNSKIQTTKITANANEKQKKVWLKYSLHDYDYFKI